MKKINFNKKDIVVRSSVGGISGAISGLVNLGFLEAILVISLVCIILASKTYYEEINSN